MASNERGQSQARVLRIGIVFEGRVVHERLIKPGHNVTIGESPKNTFVINTKFAKRHVLFQNKGSGYVLNMTSTMKGRIAAASGVSSLADLKSQGKAKKKGSGFILPLDAKMRGKVALGPVTILFQFVPAPPESARMVSRTDYRPKLIEEDDPVFFGFLSVVVVVAAVMMIYIWNTEPIESVPIEEIPDRFVDMVMPPKEEPKPVEQKQLQDENQKSEKEEEKPKEEEKKKKKKKKELTEAEKQAKEAARLKKKKEDVLKKSKLLAGIIGTRGEGSEMTVEDVFADKEGSFQNLQDALQNAGGIDVASGDNIAMKGATDAGGRGDATIEDLKQSGGGSAKVTKVKAKVRKGSASMGAIDVSSGEAVDKIRAVLRKYSGQIKYCYEQRLRENPNLKGRIAIEVSVNAGKVAGVDIVENTTGDAGVGTCVSRKVKSWRFPSDVTDDIYLPFALASSG